MDDHDSPDAADPFMSDDAIGLMQSARRSDGRTHASPTLFGR
jgi:hypothetical protein